MLILAIAGIAVTNAQVRISGSEAPNQSAVLDLNPDDRTSEGNATGGLAMPRVKLKNTANPYPLLTHVKGMTVYNLSTEGDVSPGVYTANGSRWVRQADSESLENLATNIYSTVFGDTIINYLTQRIATSELGDSIINLVHENERDGIVGNEVTGATPNGGLIRSGAGTVALPYTLGISSSGVTNIHLANNAVSTEKISDNAVTSAKIAEGTITDADINTSAAIALNKIALPDASANNGKVLKSNGTSWVAGDDNNTDANTTYSAGNGLTLAGTTFGIGSNQVDGTMIADGAVATAKLAANAVTSEKIANSTIKAEDLNGMGATNGQVLTYTGGAWAPSNNYATRTTITSSYTDSGTVTSGGYSDVFVWTGLQSGLYSLRLRLSSGTAKFKLVSDVAYGTSVLFEVNSDSGDRTAEVMFNFVYTGTLRLQANCTGGCPTRIFNLDLVRF